MAEALAAVLGVPIVLYVAWLMVRRRPGMTETERLLEDQSRELRAIRKEQEARRYR